ncbi:MAG: PAS domain-containing protein [Phycisphaerales bacterium]|nr:PAS domain-containing protein [Phycisphaerales bacterium]
MGPTLVGALGVVGVGALGYLCLPDATSGWLVSQGVALPDRQGLALSSGVFLVLTLAAGIWARRRLRALLQVRDALLAFVRGERAAGALWLSGAGPLAEAWNAFLEWRIEHAEKQAMASALRPANSERGGESFSDLLWHGVLVVDEQLVIRYVNGAAAILLGSRREALHGMDARQAIKDERVLGAVRHAAETSSRQKQSFDVGDATDPQRGVLRFSVRSSGADTGRRVLVMIEDVTQQRVSEAVQHAFVAQAAHELRTPLTNIRLYVEELTDEELDPAERGRALNVLTQETGRLDRIVSDMLSVAEIQSGRLNVTDGEVRIAQMFSELESDYAQAAQQKQLTLTFDMPPKFPMIRGDREKIGLVLHNLLGNAVKYTPRGGTVRVVVREEGDRLITEVVDTGIGIGEDDLGKVFDRFVRGSDPRVTAETGTGLGLALARDIARLHGGDVVAQSELNVGSTFSFWLPVARRSPCRRLDGGCACRSRLTGRVR